MTKLGEAINETQKALAETERDLANSARDRLSGFAIKIGADYQCPDCWIERGVNALLQPLRSLRSVRYEGDAEQLIQLRCDACMKSLNFSVQRKVQLEQFD